MLTSRSRTRTSTWFCRSDCRYHSPYDHSLLGPDTRLPTVANRTQLYLLLW